MSESKDELVANKKKGDERGSLEKAAKGEVKPAKKPAKKGTTKEGAGSKKKSLFKVSSAVKAKVIKGVLIVVTLAVIGFAAWNVYRTNAQPIVSASLIQVIERSDLKCAASKYEGICAKGDERYPGQYEYVYTYVAQASAYLENLDQQQSSDSPDGKRTRVEIDDDAKVVKVTMPDPSAFKTEVNVSTDDVHYVVGSDPVDPNEAVRLAKEDAMTELQDRGLLIKTAQDNARLTVEGLIQPLLSGTEYRLEIVEPDAPASTEAGQSAGEAA